MSAGVILTLGFGTFGGVGKLVTLGYSSGVAAAVFTSDGNARIGLRTETIDAGRIGVGALTGSANGARITHRGATARIGQSG